MYTSIISLIRSLNILFISLWYVGLVFFRPKGITLVVNASFLSWRRSSRDLLWLNESACTWNRHPRSWASHSVLWHQSCDLSLELGSCFWTGLVNVGEVNADYPLSVFLLDQDHIRDPVRVLYFPDHPIGQQSVHLVVDDFVPFWTEAPLFLFDRLRTSSHIWSVH